MALTQSTLTKDLFGEPGLPLIGDPTVADGEGLVEFSEAPRVSILPRFFSQIADNELQQMLADGPLFALQGVRITLQVLKAQAAHIAALCPAAGVVSTDGLKFTTSLTRLTPPTLCIVPRSNYGSGVTSKFNWWFPAVQLVELTEFIFKTENGGRSEGYSATFEALLRQTDHAGATMLDGYKMMFRDNPANAITPLSPAEPWTLPSGY